MQNFLAVPLLALFPSLLCMGPTVLWAEDVVLPKQPIISAAPSQRIGPDDLLSIEVYQLPEMTRTVRVDASGFIKLPQLTVDLKVGGLVVSELELLLAGELTKEELMVSPIVSVSIVEYKSRPVSVNGAVRKPVVFQAFGTMTLLDALAKAEGLLPEAGSEIIISGTQRSSDHVEGLLVRIPVDQLLSKSDPSLNIPLVGGENIRVPEAGKIFIVGNVKHPGAFRMSQSGDTTVLKLLALSEGLSSYSSKTAYIYRKDSPGPKSEIPVNLHEIVERKAPDVVLQANDIFYVPDNKNRRLTMTTLDRIITFGAGTASGVLIWH